jgi:uncharacterized protein (TIGR02001 family)
LPRTTRWPSTSAPSPTYRYRGISQTRLKPALQGGVDYTAGSFYVGAWVSTIQWIKDGGGKADVEIDIYGGYKFELAKDTRPRPGRADLPVPEQRA